MRGTISTSSRHTPVAAPPPPLASTKQATTPPPRICTCSQDCMHACIGTCGRDSMPAGRQAAPPAAVLARTSSTHRAFAGPQRDLVRIRALRQAALATTAALPRTAVQRSNAPAQRHRARREGIGWAMQHAAQHAWKQVGQIGQSSGGRLEGEGGVAPESGGPRRVRWSRMSVRSASRRRSAASAVTL